jgi:uroporphyrin-III C-methyltransferase
MRVLRGTLAALGPLVSDNKVKSPALIVIGEVAGRGDMMELKQVLEAVQ